MTTRADERAVARGVLDRIEGDRLVLSVPGTDYHIHLRLAGAGDGRSLRAAVGKRVRGTIEGRALRIHPAAGGGRFIEPVMGEPRIVAGTLRAVDEGTRRVLVEAAVPMWLETQPQQDFAVLRVGGLVNCHVESGATFAPAKPEQ